MTEHIPTKHTFLKKIKKTIDQNAILVSGILVSIAILFHGVIVSTLGSTKSESAGQIDKALIAKIVKTPVSPHRYFGDQTPTEQIVLTEYSDTECPFCKNFHSTMSQVISEGQGNIAWVYKHFPLSFHPNAQKEAESIECVREIEGDVKAFQFMDAVFAITPSNNKLAKESLYEISGAMKFHTKKIKECVDSGKYASKVLADLEEGSRKGVQGTPFTFVTQNKNGQVTELGIINGAQPIEAIQAILSQAK